MADTLSLFRTSTFRRWHRSGVMLLMLVVLTAPGALHAADNALITIQDRIWGFDGRVQIGQFNPVSFLIDNRTEEPIDAVASLRRVDGLAGFAGGRYEQSVFIGPGAQRWVQLYPYISTDDQAGWILELGEQEFRGLTQPRSTTATNDLTGKKKPLPAAVILDAPGTMSLRPTTVKHFPEIIFPPWATATVGLHTVFMDHTPDWEEPRQLALMSWLRGGGRLHLLQDSRGTWPQFSGPLSDLSQPLDSFSVGSGTVTRHRFQRTELTEAAVRSALGVNDRNRPEELSDEELTVGRFGVPSSNARTTDLSWMDESWFDAMRQFTQPDHAWWLIFLLSFIYIGAIFPGCWIIARHYRHFLIVYGTIAGLSIVFSGLFLVIGRRGYGEFTTQHTVAVSHVLDDNTQSVLEWNALFVTSGDQYTVSSSDEQAMFSIPGLRQESSAVMTAGNDGQLTVGIPPFSTQTFICRRQMPIADWQMSVLRSRPVSEGIADLVLQYGPGLEISSKAQVYAQYGKQLYRVTHDSRQRQLKQTGRVGSVARFCDEYYRQAYDTFGWGYYADDTAEDFYQALMPAVVIRSLADESISNPREFQLPADRVRLYLYTELPEAHFVETHTDPLKQGRILYVRDIPLNSETNMAAVDDDG